MLGNVSTTIAELCSAKEIYPLFLVCLEYLQSVNTDDSAGRKVYNWEEIISEPTPAPVVEEPAVDLAPETPVTEESTSTIVYTYFDDETAELDNPEMWDEEQMQIAYYVVELDVYVDEDTYYTIQNYIDNGGEF